MPSNKQSFLVSFLLVGIVVLAQLLIHVNSQSAPTPTYSISLLAGTGEMGRVDGPGSSAKFGLIQGACMNSSGKTLYVLELAGYLVDNYIRKIDIASKNVSTMTQSSTSSSCSVALNGDIYIGGNGTISKMVNEQTLSAVVNSFGYQDASAKIPLFVNRYLENGIAASPDGKIYLGFMISHTVRVLTPTCGSDTRYTYSFASDSCVMVNTRTSDGNSMIGMNKYVVSCWMVMMLLLSFLIHH
ncbi:hypothetical protein FDP41_009783 [Naegleria fowleri]|uniref:SMP-30/Gluconolactonase/LRE-like region domain-containing protein n=1 Tax=Naegleria fowleri TaxID=5763 RepID=A0A6A5B0L7_NAEFO|nr:uncharacterized protein FDP41_009783 [Naegleria fowleri]KAF0972087.1 hypothetical protein FDP41_009783 [Naegleria fowleri]